MERVFYDKWVCTNGYLKLVALVSMRINNIELQKWTYLTSKLYSII